MDEDAVRELERWSFLPEVAVVGEVWEVAGDVALAESCKEER